MTADLGPAATPRPIPTQEERMRHATTDTSPSFATYLDRTERDQLDARAATAEQERDDALDDRDAYREARDTAQQLATFRQGVIDRHRQELGAAGEVIAVVRDAMERIDRALAAYDTEPSEQPEQQDAPHEDPARLRQQLADAHADCARYATERDEARDTVNTARKALEEGNGNALWDALNVTKAPPLSPPIAALGSPPPRAQDDLTDRLAAALTEARRTHYGSGVRPGTLERWRALLAEYAAHRIAEREG